MAGLSRELISIAAVSGFLNFCQLGRLAGMEALVKNARVFLFFLWAFKKEKKISFS